MQRVLRAFPNTSTNTNNNGTKRIYKRFHRKPQILSSNTQANKTYKTQTNLEDESMNNYIFDIYKEKKYRGILDPTAPNNKNIFVETDSEFQKTERNRKKLANEKKSEKLLIAKTESQYPDTYNSNNVFRRDGLVKGYFIKVDENNNNNNIINNINNNNVYNQYNTLTKNSRKMKINLNTPSPAQDTKLLYNNYSNGAKTQVRDSRVNQNFLNQTYNKNNITNSQFKKEIDLDEWPSIERTYEAKLDFRNKDIKTDNSNNIENDNINQYQSYYKKQGIKYPVGMVYQKGNIGEMKGSYSKSNMSDMSEDYLSQHLRKPETNYFVAGNTPETGSPFNFRNNYIMGTSEEESERQYNNEDPQIYMNKRIIKNDMNNVNEAEQGGIVDLNYGINKGKNRIINNNIRMRKNRDLNNILNSIQNDINKYNLLIKLQKCIKSYLYLREICAMKIQAVWRGGNTRRIMDLYNDIDEFIYHLSKVQFNHFNNNFCFFIKQLFNIYKANLPNRNYIENEDNEINNDDEENIENENCMNQLTLEEIEKKENTDEYLYKYPEGSCFDPEKLELENEIALFVEGSNPYERKNEKKFKEYERLLRDYEELNQQYNELKLYNTASNRFAPKKDKNEPESALGSIQKEFKFQKNEKFSSHSKDKVSNKKNLERRLKTGDNAKNLTISNEYDADLDINRDDDFFNQEISYDDKDNSGFLQKEKKYSYFSLHSDENSKYFDNENPKEKEIKEGDIFKINSSKNSGGSKYNNNSTKNTGYTGYFSLHDKSKITGLPKTEKSNKELTNSPSEKSNNYIGHHSKTFQRKFKTYTDSNNSTLIIPKHEEDFHIINKKLYLSPKDREEKTHKKNIRSDNAISTGIRLEDKNWNEIIEYIKNEEIEIPTQKRVKNVITQKEPKKFDILEKDKSHELNIDNKDYRNKKLSQIFVEHENELNIIRRKSKQEIEKEKALIKSIEEKDAQIALIKQKLEEITNKLKEAKVFNSKLEINKNLNNLYINGIKKQKIILDKINIDKINISRKPKEYIPKITKNNEICINELKAIPETIEETTDTTDLNPKQIIITTKKIVKKTDTIQYRFKNNLIISENALNINGKEKMKPVFEKESQENNRFSVAKMGKEESKDNAEQKIEKEEEKNVLRVKVINPEELEVNKPIEFIIIPDEEKLKEKKEELEKKEIFEKVNNNEITLNPSTQKEIKIVTKKIIKKTNLIHSKFNDNKTLISTENKLDIKGTEKPKEPEPVQKEVYDWKNNEIAQEKMFNINGIGKKFENIQLPKEEDKNDNNRFCIENDSEVPVIYKIDNTQRENKNIINKKSQFAINGIVKKPEENIINAKSKFTINGIQKEPVPVNEEGIQYERNVDDLSEKMTDTFDLIPKEIKITTKKIIKKTNIIKKYNNNIVSLEFQIQIEGNEMPEEKIAKEEEKQPKEEPIENKDWNKILKKDCQTYDFVIKSISKNIYKKYDELKLNQEKEKLKKEEEKLKEKEEEKIKEKEAIKEEEEKKEEKEIIKEQEEIKEQEKKEESKIIKELDKREEKEMPKEVENIENKEMEISKEKQKEEKAEELPKEKIIYIEKEKDWNKLLTKENQPNISIERILQSISNPQENIIEKKIYFNIFGIEETKKEIVLPEPKEEPVQTEPIKYQSDWKDLLKEDIQEKEFIIKGKEIEIKKPNEMQKDIIISIKPTNSLPLAKNKVLEDWKDTNLQEQSETLNIENQKKREIKITTKKILKKTNNIYKKFGNNLEITKNDLGITGKTKEKNTNYMTENMQINIDKTYQPKIMKELEVEKNKEMFINADDYGKKQIQIRTKITVAKTNYVYKRFTNNKIIDEAKISIENATPQSTIISSFGNENLEKVKINENKFTIEKTEDPKKEKELKETIQKETEVQLEIKFQKEKEEMQKDFENQNNELKNKLEKEKEEMKNKLEKENAEIKTKLEKENENLRNKFEKDNEDLKIKLEKENEEIKNKLEKENKDLKIKFEKENEELKTKLIKEKEELKIKLQIEKENEIKELKEKQNNFENVLPIATDEFSVDNDYDEEEEKKRKLEDIIEEYYISHMELCFEKKPKQPIQISEQGIQKDEEKPKMDEKTTDTFDLENREIKITHKRILKKTNVLYHQFKNNSICSDTKININKPSNMLKERNKVINKVESLSIDKKEPEKEKENKIILPKTNNLNLLEIKKNEDINISKNQNLGQNNNIIYKVDNIQLFNDKLPKPEEKITEKSFGDNNQLTIVKCHKSNKKLTDKKNNTYQGKSASFNNIITVNISPNSSEKGDEEDKKLYKKRKAPNNKKKKMVTLVIKLDNKCDLKNCFNKWNTLTPNILIKKEKKEERPNIKQIIKEKNKDKNTLSTLDNNNERITDTTTNIEKSLEDSNINPQKVIYNNYTKANNFTNNFETINLDKNINIIEPSLRISEEIEDLNNSNKKKKLKLKNILLNTQNKQNDGNKNEEKEEIINKENDMNLNSINSNNDEIIYKDKKDIDENKRKSVNSNNCISLNNDTSSSIEIIEKSSLSKNDQEKFENQNKEEEPKKKEILINKKISIVSKNAQKGAIINVEAKKKFLYKRFMIKFWKIWKNNTFKMLKSLDPKSAKKPFTFKPKKIHKRILGSKETFKSIKNKLMSQNQNLIIRYFFLKWNKDIVHESNEFKGIRIIENILRRHIVRYLLMHGKMMKLKRLLIKYALSRKK